jgi:hypothetical protein
MYDNNVSAMTQYLLVTDIAMFLNVSAMFLGSAMTT